jgi:protein-S-isoprenylcysteine O-methyltransferase Ste14
MFKGLTSSSRKLGLIITIVGILTIIGGLIYSQYQFYIGSIITLLGMILFLIGIGIITFKIRPPHPTTQKSD